MRDTPVQVGAVWPAEVAVAVPTVTARAAHLAVTLGDLRRVGADPLVHLQDETWPLCHDSNLRHVTVLLDLVLRARPDATHILLWEDDVEPDPQLPELLPALLDGRVWSLWAAGLRFYPADVKALLRGGLPLPCRRATPAKDLPSWHGSLAVLMPRADAEAIQAWPVTTPPGWDIRLREWLRAHRRQLWLPVPNLAEHRGTVSAVEPRGTSGLARSAAWRTPVEDDSWRSPT